MPLIQCADCPKQISDKADNCPNCGCPVKLSLEKANALEEHVPQTQNHRMVDGVPIDFTNILTFIKNGKTKDAVLELVDLTGLSIGMAREVIEKIKSNNSKLPSTNNIKAATRTPEEIEIDRIKKETKEKMKIDIAQQQRKEEEQRTRRTAPHQMRTTYVSDQLVNHPRCPTCSSADVEKIGTLERGASVSMWGLLSKKINKSFKCKNCGYTW